MFGRLFLGCVTVSALFATFTSTARAQIRNDLAVLTRNHAGAPKATPAKTRTIGPKSAALGMLRLYQVVLSPQDAPVCNFTVSCSRFAVRAIEEHGLLHGSAMAADRILRCNGLSGGHYDIHSELLLAIDLPIEKYRLGRARR